MNRHVSRLRRTAALLLLACLAPIARAQGPCPPGPVLCPPGSLLIYPEFDDVQFQVEGFGDSDVDGRDYLVTVTNTHASASILVEFVYIDATECLEFNRTEPLTPSDTLSVITRFHNPKFARGYLYVFAKSPTTGQAIKFDHLIGDELVYDAFSFGAFEYSHRAFVFPAGDALPDGAPTDVDGDGVRDLNGIEYRRVPDRLLFPRFLGQSGQGFPRSELILIALSGGAAFETRVNFMAFNDNEFPLSTQYAFQCWERVPLLTISQLFSNTFLQSTDHAANEILGAVSQEAGWFRIDGQIALSVVETIADPAVLAVLIERVGAQSASDLPFAIGAQSNGDLLPHGVFGDGPNPVAGDNQ